MKFRDNLLWGSLLKSGEKTKNFSKLCALVGSVTKPIRYKPAPSIVALVPCPALETTKQARLGHSTFRQNSTQKFIESDVN